MDYYKSERDIIDDLREDIKTISRLLYDIGNDVEEQGLLSKMRGDFQKWFADHKVIVAEQGRRRAENKEKWDLAYAAKKKLTEKEIEAMRFMFSDVTIHF